MKNESLNGRAVPFEAMGLIDWFRRRGWSLTGLGKAGPTFGRDPSASERTVIEELLVVLADRDCLTMRYDAEFEGWVMDSVIAIRSELTDSLKRPRIDSPARRAVIRMRDATRSFMRSVPEPHRDPFSHLRDEYRDALTELRAEFRAALESLHTDGFEHAEEIALAIPETADGPRFHPDQLTPARTISIEPLENPVPPKGKS